MLGKLTRMLVIPVIATMSVSASANLLNNSGYEDPLGFDFADVTNWNGFFGGPAGTVLTAFNDTGAPAFEGAQALELGISAGTDDAGNAVNGTNAFTGHAQSVSGITEGEEYILSTFSRNNNSALTGAVEFRIEWRNAGGAEISRDQILLEGSLTNEYQEFTITALAPTGAVEANIVKAVASFNQDVPHDHSVLFDNTTFDVVPEPASLALLGLGTLAMIRRRAR